MILTHLVLLSFLNGASPAAVADTPATTVVLAPGFEPGPPPRVGDYPNRQADLDFWALAKIANVSHYLDDVQEWMGDEGVDTDHVDVFADDFEPDEDLFGKPKRRR